MPIKHESSVPSSEMRAAFLEAAGELWDKNAERFLTLADQSTDKAVKLSFAATLDFNDSEPSMEVDLSFGQRFKDKRTLTFGNPNQPEFLDRSNTPVPFPGAGEGSGQEPPAEPEKKKRGRKKSEDNQD
jgi:hypothetical protein